MLKPTGRTRHRVLILGRFLQQPQEVLVLQIELKSTDTDFYRYVVWRDATTADVTIQETENKVT